jgi:hypothetical protein
LWSRDVGSNHRKLASTAPKKVRNKRRCSRPARFLYAGAESKGRIRDTGVVLESPLRKSDIRTVKMGYDVHQQEKRDQTPLGFGYRVLERSISAESRAYRAIWLIGAMCPVFCIKRYESLHRSF